MFPKAANNDRWRWVTSSVSSAAVEVLQPLPQHQPARPTTWAHLSRGGPDYGGRPRPLAILQDDRFEDLPSLTFCPFTTNPTPAPGSGCA